MLGSSQKNENILSLDSFNIWLKYTNTETRTGWLRSLKNGFFLKIKKGTRIEFTKSSYRVNYD